MILFSGESGDLSVIVFLAVLLVLVMLVCLAQCLYIMVYKPYRKRMNTNDSYAADNDGFEMAEAVSHFFVILLGGGPHSLSTRFF